MSGKTMWAFGASAGVAFAGNGDKIAPPNIVILLADDLGYADLSIHGATDVKTPHIDALFRGGMQFREAYVSYPACGPSRASLLTGRHHMRFGFPCNPDHIIPTAPGNLLGLPRGELTLADLMTQQGYATGMFGKWHLGFQKENHPLNRGFDEFFGFIGSLYRYFDLGNMHAPNSILRGFERVHEKEYLTDAFTRESIDFIERHKEKPFFLYVPHLAVHTPLMYDTDPGNANIPLNGTGDPAENRRMMVSMIKGLDRSVGAILRKLRECGLEEKTLIIFLSDNGGPNTGQAYSNGPLRGWKGQAFEGGVRVPMAAYWPGVIAPGVSYPYPVSSMDLLATAVDAAWGDLPADRQYDSKSLLPVMTGTERGRLHDEPMFWDALGMQAIRHGDWKLVMRGRKVEGLYNIPADEGEKNNLASAYPERVRDLRNAFDHWSNSLLSPIFEYVGPQRFAEWEKKNGAIR